MDSRLTDRKADLRLEYRGRWSQLARDQKELQKRVDKLTARLVGVLPEGVKIGAFKALPDEPDLSGAFLQSPHRIAYPRLEGKNIAFYLPRTAAAFELNSYKIWEPIPEQSEKIAPHDLPVLVIPALGYDRQGFRLGRGKGFYDRYLQDYIGLKIGVVLAAQVANEEFPHAEHDVAMNMVVTEDFVLQRFDS